jgi:hypothetical protein
VALDCVADCAFNMLAAATHMAKQAKPRDVLNEIQVMPSVYVNSRDS